MSIHPLEIASLLLSILAAICSWALFTLKLTDLIQVKDSQTNGPLLFMTRDNIRRQGFTLAVCAGMVMLSVSGYHNDGPVTPQARNLLTGMCGYAVMIVAESVFIYRRREKMPLLIAIQERMLDRLPGGKRKSDPPSIETGEPA